MVYQNLLDGAGRFCSREGIVMIKRGSDPARPLTSWMLLGCVLYDGAK